ncbi:MAG: hypothetical protein OHK93_006699 [Ramalina farinacea]|uniref:Mediator of RNA polymerase II transcription subunit 4 n=1 Tax=Ramalina farinacea TaxID=258253 RepID=A0AA43QLC1_9LECA|nr:hypothetical protein [Ramalina farinacea]
MDQILLTQLDRLEAALTTLTESISDYNPSVPAAHALLAADEDLQRGLKQLHTHQCNQLKIQQLRDVIEAQNAQITSHLQLLADTRADLLSIPTSLPERGRREVEYGELLEYAKYVGQYTMPPNFRPSMVESAGEEVGMVGVEGEGAIAQQQQQQQSGESKVLEDILRNEKQYLDASTGIQFTPWPSEDVIKRGALARIQGMMERGEDIEGRGRLGSDKMEVEEEAREAEEGKQAAGSTVKSSAERAPARRKEEAPKVFGGLDLYDPDEE